MLDAKTKALRTDWFEQARLGLFIHWGLYTLPSTLAAMCNRERKTIEEYQKYFDHFYPDLYNPMEWARLAKGAGMKYFVITTKHHEGFCLWDSQWSDYKVSGTPWGKDIIRPMIEAFRDEGIRVGLYHSLLDWHHPHFKVDSLHPMCDNEAERKKNTQRSPKKYTEYLHRQVRELLTQFGPIDIIWFDYSYPGKDGKGCNDWASEKLLKMVRKLQPDILVNNRLDLPGSGDFETPEQFQPPTRPMDKNGKPLVWEACQTFSGSWGYNRDEMSWRDSDEIIRTLIDCVSKGGNLLLNVGPTGRGEFDYRAKERLASIGDWMHCHGRSIYGCTQAPQEFACPEGCKLTYNPQSKRLYLHILNWPYKHAHLKGSAYIEQVEYMQLLNDASEVKSIEEHWKKHLNLNDPDSLIIALPQSKPMVTVPVVELFLKK